MDKNNKHIIPRNQYKRRRRVFTDEDQEPMRNTQNNDNDQNDRHQFLNDNNQENRSHDVEYGETKEKNQSDGYSYYSGDDTLNENSGNDEEMNFPDQDGDPQVEHDDAGESEPAYITRRNSEAFEEPKIERGDSGAGETYGNESPHEEFSYETSGQMDDAESSEENVSSENQEEPGSYGYQQDESVTGETNAESGGGDGAGKTMAAAGLAGKRPTRQAGRNVNSSSNGNSNGGNNGGNNGGQNRGSNGDDNNGKKRGAVSAFLIPLVAGMIGALIILLSFNYFSGSGSNNDVASENAADSEISQEDVDQTREELESSTDEERDVSETTAAIQTARESVVSVVNLQRVDSMLPGLGEQEQEQEANDEPEEAGVGSGVIYKVDGDSAYIVTNQHVVEGAEELQVNLENGDSITGELVGSDIWTDLAVLRVEDEEIDQTVAFGDSDDLLVGEEAIAIGSPLGEAFSGSVSQGIVSGLDRSVPVDLDGDGSYDWEANVIQTDAAINPGNSGGALINSAGELIGINSMKISMPTVEGIGFAIPSKEVEKITAQIEENGEVVRPFLGVSLQDLYTLPREVIANEMNLPDDVDTGVVVSDIQDSSPAADAGIEELDVIVSLDSSEEVENMMELRQYLYYEKQPGDTMEVEFYRQGEMQSVTVTLE